MVVTLVEPHRVSEQSGVFEVEATTDDGDDASSTLVFEWDNSYSWLTDKTLDYHVTFLEPLTVDKKKKRCVTTRLDRTYYGALGSWYSLVFVLFFTL